MLDVKAIYAKRWSPAEQQAMGSVWKILVEDFFSRFINPAATVLDWGAGPCNFINHIKAKRRIAFDANEEIRRHAAPGVEVVIGHDIESSTIQPNEIDHIFMSNFLEHLPTSFEVLDVLRAAHKTLSAKGTLLILQPNFRYTGAAYFDFIDHHVVLTERSLQEALEVTGFRVVYLKKRFLPYTSKSRIPKFAWLVKLYVRLPFLHWFLGQQTFVVAAKDANVSITSLRHQS